MGARPGRSIAVALAVALQLGPLAPAHADPPARRRAAQTIDLNLQRADIRDVLRLLAEIGGVNLVYGEEVTGEVTLRLVDVPWERALWVVLSSKGLAMERRGNVVRVAPAETFAAERKAELDARARCLQSAPLRMRLIPVHYARAQALAAQIARTLSPRGSVSVDERTNTLIVSDVDCPRR